MEATRYWYSCSAAMGDMRAKSVEWDCVAESGYWASEYAMKWTKNQWPRENGWNDHRIVFMRSEPVAEDKKPAMKHYKFAVKALGQYGWSSEAFYEGDHFDAASADAAAKKYAAYMWPDPAWKERRIEIVSIDGKAPSKPSEDIDFKKLTEVITKAQNMMVFPPDNNEVKVVRTVLVLDWSASGVVKTIDDAFKMANYISETLAKPNPVLPLPADVILKPIDLPWSAAAPGEKPLVGVTVPDDRDALTKKLRDGIAYIQSGCQPGGVPAQRCAKVLDDVK